MAWNPNQFQGVATNGIRPRVVPYGPAIPTVRQFVEGYIAPFCYPLYEPPTDTANTSALFKNTRNPAYSSTQTVSGVHRWDITVAQVAVYQNVLDQPYNYRLLAPEYHPPAWGGGPYGVPYRHEHGLTSRLDETVNMVLRKLLMFIAHRHNSSLVQLPANHNPLYTEPGSCVLNYHEFLPDRSAVQQSQFAVQRTRCVGEIKPSYKFQSTWAPEPRLAGVPTSPVQKEYFSVMAQVKFYMRICGVVDMNPIATVGNAVKYGYVLTDQEVVLVRREPLTHPGTIHATVGFPLRPHDNYVAHAPAQAFVSGMFALLFIHLLAANNGSLCPNNL